MKSQLGMLVGIVVMGFGALSVGCNAATKPNVTPESAATYEAPPTLVAVEPGVWVVSRQPTAIYYVEDSYWTSRGTDWYRSDSWNDGWELVDTDLVPDAIFNRNTSRNTYVEPPGSTATRVLPPEEQVFPGIRQEQPKVDTRSRYNEMGSRWSKDEPVMQYR